MTPLLEVDSLHLSLTAPGRNQPRLDLLHGVSLAVSPGETLGLVGESGAGKSITGLAIAGLLPTAIEVTAGEIRYAGTDLVQLPERRLRRLRGRRIASVFQEPASALNPALTIGYQVEETIRAHAHDLDTGTGKQAPRERAVEWLQRVSIPDAERRFNSYPHQLSGGQRQRVVIAMALAANPSLLIADEPTTALDVTVQRQILDLLAELRADLGLAVLLITHDLAVVAETCDRIAVMYAGRIVEEAAVDVLHEGPAQPAHPYTSALLATAFDRIGAGPVEYLPTIPGRVPDPFALPTGCAFHPRCAEVMARCSVEVPHLVTLDRYRESAAGSHPHRARCFLHQDASRGAE